MSPKYFSCRVCTAAVALLLNTACSTLSTVSTLTDSVMKATGLIKPEVPELPDSQKPARSVSINLHAAHALNVDDSGRPLALVARIYKLRQNTAFQQASYDTFLSPQRERDVLGADLLEVKEVTLVPDQRYSVQEKVSHEAYFLGVVALFRAPAHQRWRASFPVAENTKTGITVGMHACAMTVGAGMSVVADTNTPHSLASVQCR